MKLSVFLFTFIFLLLLFLKPTPVFACDASTEGLECDEDIGYCPVNNNPSSGGSCSISHAYCTTSDNGNGTFNYYCGPLIEEYNNCDVCPGPLSCGDGSCNNGETQDTCPQDCGSGSLCGDSACNGGETYISCPQDCPAPAPYCGDDICNNGETQTTCPQDCGQPPSSTCTGGTTCCGIFQGCQYVCTDSACTQNCVTQCPTSSNCTDGQPDPNTWCQQNSSVGPCPYGTAGSLTCQTSTGNCVTNCTVGPGGGGGKTPVCGDHVCSSTETQNACPQDCGTPPAYQNPNFSGSISAGACTLGFGSSSNMCRTTLSSWGPLTFSFTGGASPTGYVPQGILLNGVYISAPPYDCSQPTTVLSGTFVPPGFGANCGTTPCSQASIANFLTGTNAQVSGTNQNAIATSNGYSSNTAQLGSTPVQLCASFNAYTKYFNIATGNTFYSLQTIAAPVANASQTITTILPQDTISANPNPCTLNSAGVCASTVSWNTNGSGFISIWDGSLTNKITSGSSGSFPSYNITSGGTTYNLRYDSNNVPIDGFQLGAIQVYGTTLNSPCLKVTGDVHSNSDINTKPCP